MTPKELKAIQERIKFDGPATALCLGIDYEQYRRYIYGTTEIPESVARAAIELEAIEKQFDISRCREYDKFLDSHYPRGLPSEYIDVEA